ncbi:MAG: GNAT family N-acetyltransferase [Lachnospiraceae bacterium]|nr:GNAT family N-acetyltransferase [Lachnospiraceae bacterium]
MNNSIVKIDADNYPLFDDMIFWRENGYERTPSGQPVSEQIKRELANPDLYIYAAMADNRFVGWISLVYIPKIGKWNGHGHIYVDELWVAPDFRGKGIGRALMAKADALKDELEATGSRLYVNVDNKSAKALYEKCGFREEGHTLFMEK